MPATFDIATDGTYILETVLGEHNAQMQREVARELFALIKTTGITKALVDARVQQAELSTRDAYDIWEELVLLVPRHAQFAILVRWSLKGRVFAETVAVNRRVHLR